MKTHVILLYLFLFLHAITTAQNVGIGNTTPMEQLSVGSNSQFRVNSTGNLVRINDIPYSFPSEQGTNQYLKNDGAGNLTWAAAPRPVVRVFSVINNGSTTWQIDAASDYVVNNNNNPTLVLQRGLTYQFNISATGHPFWISTSAQSGSFNVGVTGNGTQSGTITFTVPMDAPATLFYYCSAHPMTMKGTLTIN